MNELYSLLIQIFEILKKLVSYIDKYFISWIANLLKIAGVLLVKFLEQLIHFINGLIK